MGNEVEERTDEQQTEQALKLETVKAWLESNDEGKKFMQSVTDAKVTKALKTYTDETVPKLVDQKVKELYPEETEEQKKLRQLGSELEQIRNEAKREKLTNLALSEATKKGLPPKLVRFLVGQDEDTTLKNVEEFESEFFSNVTNQVQEQFKTGGRRVPQQTPNTRVQFTNEDVRKMTPEEFLKNKDAINQSLNK